MKKIIFTGLLAAMGAAAGAQATLRPPTREIQRKWIGNKVYEMDWFFVRDTVLSKMARVRTEWLVQDQKLTVVTNVTMKNSQQPWVDTTVASLPGLKPLRHASYNMQRAMVLDFGPTITGYYNDKMKKQTLPVNDSLAEPCFDSNLYPMLLGWLRLKPGYTASLAIYDFNPRSKSGQLRAMVTSVRKGVYKSDKSGDRPVWLVTAKDEMGNGQNGVSTYYFDRRTRQLWRQDIVAGSQKMMMKLVE